MPYIEQEKRSEVSPNAYGVLPAENAGQLNYQITELIQMYLDNPEAPINEKPKLNYQLINDVLGALEGAKAEFYRRMVVPFEDQKIKENGDVY